MVALIILETFAVLDVESWSEVFTYSVGYVMEISITPDSPPARIALPLCFGALGLGAMVV